MSQELNSGASSLIDGLNLIHIDCALCNSLHKCKIPSLDVSLNLTHEII